MNQPDPVVGLTERYQTNQVVVDLPYRDEVQHVLRRNGIGAEPGQTDPRLGLGLIELRNLDTEVRGLEGYEDLRDFVIKDRRRRNLEGDPPALDIVMRFLREAFGNDNDTWTPAMGKNRDLEVIEGRPHHGGGEGFPSKEAQAFELGSRTDGAGYGVRVGMLDTGLFENSVLNGRYLSDDLVPAKDPQPEWAGHATFVAGLILQRAPGVDLDVRRVLSDQNGTARGWEVARKMAQFMGSGVEVLNLSFGCHTDDGEPPFVLTRAIERLSPEIVIVASAGNHGDFNEEYRPGPHAASGLAPTEWRMLPRSQRSPMWPAAYPDVVAVGAAGVGRIEDQFTFAEAPFNPRDVAWLDLFAPGLDVPSTYLNGRVEGQRLRRLGGGAFSVDPKDLGVFDGFAKWSGTSFAAANVTGEIAKIASPGAGGTGGNPQRMSARAALAEIRSRSPHGTDYDIRPAIR